VKQVLAELGLKALELLARFETGLEMELVKGSELQLALDSGLQSDLEWSLVLK
jgi:hypothetical protein